jgi:hypothetical protein
LTDRTPTFSGKAAARSRLTVTITGSSLTNATATTADASGNWSYTPRTNLSVGAHTITFTAFDPQNRQSTASVGIEIIANTSSSAPAVSSPTSTSSALPVAGTTTPTLAILGTGLALILYGSYLMLAKKA